MEVCLAFNISSRTFLKLVCCGNAVLLAATNYTMDFSLKDSFLLSAVHYKGVQCSLAVLSVEALGCILNNKGVILREFTLDYALTELKRLFQDV